MSAVFDIDDVVVVTKDGLYKNHPVLIKGWHAGKPWDIFYDCETTDEPPKTLVINEKDLISFDDYLEDMNIFDMTDDEVLKSLDDLLPELDLDFEWNNETELIENCECGAEKSGLSTHSHWCPKYD